MSEAPTARVAGTENYFEHDADVGVIGRGATPEEAPGTRKGVDPVAEVTERTGLARRVEFPRPKVCIQG